MGPLAAQPAGPVGNLETVRTATASRASGDGLSSKLRGAIETAPLSAFPSVRPHGPWSDPSIHPRQNGRIAQGGISPARPARAWGLARLGDAGLPPRSTPRSWPGKPGPARAARSHAFLIQPPPEFSSSLFPGPGERSVASPSWLGSNESGTVSFLPFFLSLVRLFDVLLNSPFLQLAIVHLGPGSTHLHSIEEAAVESSPSAPPLSGQPHTTGPTPRRLPHHFNLPRLTFVHPLCYDQSKCLHSHLSCRYCWRSRLRGRTWSVSTARALLSKPLFPLSAPGR